MQKEELDKADIFKKLNMDAKKAREYKHHNQINLILKNRLNDIGRFFMEADLNHNGQMNYEKFEASLRKLGINENILTENDIKHLFQKNKHDDYSIDYRKLIDDLKSFTFIQEEAYREDGGQSLLFEQKQESNKLKMNLIKRATLSKLLLNDIDENLLNEDGTTKDGINIIDCRGLPVNQLQNYFEKSRKVVRSLKRYFPDKNEFKDHLIKTLKIDPEKLDNKSISKKELKKLIENLFNNFDDDKHLSKKDFQGFFSTFIYNKHGYTNFNEILYTIFE